jgi:hypothetical protein
VKRPDPEAVHRDLQEAIRPEVEAEVDSRLRWWRIQMWALYGIVFIAGVVAVWALDSESSERKHQNCQIFERNNLEAVARLRNTYRYLMELPPEERSSQLNRAVLRQLPEIEANARADAAPPYCDDEGVGLDEPDPEIPARPPGLSPLG